jgi:4-diphosphocytidyl-2-C-methyl-D-erythritol kinase
VNSLTLFSPAKVNLSFRVLNKREDGYHNIASVMQCVSLGDTLTYALTEGVDTFMCNDPSLTGDPSNLIYKAVHLFKKKTGLEFSLNVQLEKKIPMQAGLGGGSSNAATTLYALNQLLETQLEDSILAEWGSAIGADVPCFFSLGRVLCEGIGERLTLLTPVYERYWLAKPQSLSLATPAVYKQCKIDLRTAQEPCTLFTNDLEKAAFELLPVLQEFKQQCVQLGFKQVVMTGSGTAFICQGEVHKPQLPDTVFMPVETLNRQAGSWYAPS